MAINLVTGHTGTSHVTSEQAGSYNAGIIGSGKFVLGTKNQFSYDLISNNLIRIKSGDIVDQGRHISIDLDDYEEITIDNGLQGVKRNDIIVAKYTKNAETDIESCSLAIVKGVSGDTATDPEIVTRDILSGDIEDDVPLYRIKINGLNVEAVETMFEVLPDYYTQVVRINELESDVTELNQNLIFLEGTKQVLVASNNATNVSVSDIIKTPSGYKLVSVMPSLTGTGVTLNASICMLNNGNEINIKNIKDGTYTWDLSIKCLFMKL